MSGIVGKGFRLKEGELAHGRLGKIVVHKFVTQSVTIFVRRMGKIFVANTHEQEAISPLSPQLAAIECGARHLRVRTEDVEIERETEFVFVARIKAPSVPRKTIPLTWAILGGAALFGAGFCAAVYTIGLIETGGAP